MTSVGPAEPDDSSIMLDMVADEFLTAIERKDKKLLCDALRALVMHVQDEDREQDQE